VLRDLEQAAELERLLRLTPHAHAEFRATYGDLPADPIERARRLLVRSHMGFGDDAVCHDGRTGFRSGSFRRGTTPAHDWSRFPEQIKRFTARLQGVTIEERPAEEIITKFDSTETLFYVDPPYCHEARTKNGRYRHEMDQDAHERLAALLRGVAGMVALSGYRCPLYDTLYGDWRREERATHADGARDRVEVLWLNPACVTRLPQRLLFDSVAESPATSREP
jgi:DNA adenine methylase